MDAFTYKGVILPSVRGIEAADFLAHSYPAVITAGPSKHEVNWGHPNHHVETFGDTCDAGRNTAPRFRHVERMIDFGGENDGPILIHCHAGVSRSTATAIGVAIKRGLSPETAVRALADIHPATQWFRPNRLILDHVEAYFNLPEHTLGRLANQYERVPARRGLLR